jgi:hypothetical protein
MGYLYEAADDFLQDAPAVSPPGRTRPPMPARQHVRGPPQPPRIVRRETEPPAETLYVRIPLGSEDPAAPLTGIFLPNGYRAQPTVDVLLYLHGFKAPELSIARYWRRSGYPNHILREELNASNKNVVLVAPTLGPHSQAGWLVHRGGLDRYLGSVRAALAQSGAHRGTTPPLRHLILSCHSGGGWPMRQLALGSGDAPAHVRECWGFDCLYNRGDETAWAEWARARPSARLYIHYGNGHTAAKSELLRRQGVPNVFVEGSVQLAHDAVPRAHWRERLRAAAFLDDV